MARASKALTDWIEVPHEPGNRFKFRMLTHIQLEEAADVVTDRALAHARDVVDLADVVAKVAAVRAAAGTTTAPDADPAAKYDRATVCRYGLAEWSGPLYLHTLDALGRHIDPAVDADDLDTATATWAAAEIIRHSCPTDATVGKGSSRSTGSLTEPGPSPTDGT